MEPQIAHRELIARVLGDGFITFTLAKLSVTESPDGHCHVKVAVQEPHQLVEAEGSGVGVVDAMVNGLLARYGREYASLRSLSLAGFALSTALETKTAQTGLDAMCTATIDVNNSEGRRFSFSETSRSVTLSTAAAVLKFVEHFVNSERAFILLDKARRDAIARNREDLVSRYTAEMAELVESTSYTEVIAGIRRGLK